MKVLVGALALIGLIACLVHYNNPNPPIEVPKTGDSPFDPRKGNREGGKISALKHIDAEGSEREEHLKQLKRRWQIEIDRWEGGDAISDRQCALAAESVRLLGLSDQMIKLLEFLESTPKPHYGSELFVRSIRGGYLPILRSGSAEVRESLQKLDPRADLKHRWVFEAAKYWEEGDLEQFIRATHNDPRSLQAAVFGLSTKDLQTDPLRSLTAVAKELDNGRLAAQSGSILRDLASKVPLDADFQVIDNALPPDSTNQFVRAGRMELLARWASSDPAAAVNHILDNPDRISPNSISRVLEPFLSQDLPGAIEWLQSIPPGPHLDVALVAGVDAILLDYPKEARQLAEKIETPEFRRAKLNEVTAMENELK